MSEQQRPAVPTSVVAAIAACPVRPGRSGSVASYFREDLLGRGVTWIHEVIDVTRDGEQWITKNRMTLVHVEQREVLSLDWFGVGAGYAESIYNARHTFASSQTDNNRTTKIFLKKESKL